MEELLFFKNKNGTWTCKDRAGRTANGISKDFARNNYYLAYVVNKEPEIPEINIAEYFPELNLGDK